ncbi:hypothetical protein EM308_17730 [Flavobacterium gilvum]|uniref:Uncharacterized protein n=1 Tax=Flavobacterium gilvum TaxID=1492737 RepID=A0AAC9N7V0_9FLAO|nr:hypothetical protein EM308_17730 [Flavobacterium gilvum]
MVLFLNNVKTISSIGSLYIMEFTTIRTSVLMKIAASTFFLYAQSSNLFLLKAFAILTDQVFFYGALAALLSV